MRYRTIVADPPWPYEQGWPTRKDSDGRRTRVGLPYEAMRVAEVAFLPVKDLADTDCSLFLWTTNRYLEQAMVVARAWDFAVSQVLTWCKPPQGLGPGGTFCNTTEFVIHARRGKPLMSHRVDTSWFVWPRGRHSEKPEAFLDLVESLSPGPYLEMFARRNRLGWDTYGNEALEHVEIPA